MFKQAPNVAWRRVEKDAIILNLDTSVYYSLNEAGSFIWERLASGVGVDDVNDALCREFDVDPGVSRRDIEEMVRSLREHALLVPA